MWLLHTKRERSESQLAGTGLKHTESSWAYVTKSVISLEE